MKISKQMLKQIIKEELSDVMYEDDDGAAVVGAGDEEDVAGDVVEPRSYTLDEVGAIVEEIKDMVSEATGLGSFGSLRERKEKRRD